MTDHVSGSAVEPPARHEVRWRRALVPMGRAATAVWRGTVTDKVRAGRLRDVGWPYGLRAVVIIGLLGFGVAVLVALASVPLRRASALAVPNSLESSAPEGLIWLLVLLLTVSLALLHTAAIHGPWWSLTLGLILTLIQIGTWGVAISAIGGLLWGLPLMIIAMIFTLVFSLVRKRRGFAWWEFPVLLAVTGGVVAAGLYAFAGQSRDLGFLFAPVFLDQFVQVLQFFVLPAALAAGAAVAEIAVGATVLATRQAQRLTRRWWPYVILAVVVGIRFAQTIVQLITLDPVDQGPLALVPATAMVLGFALVSWLVIRLARRSGTEQPVVSGLPEGLGRIGLPVAVVMIGLQLPVIVLIFGLNIIAFADPEHRLLRSPSFTPQVIIERGVDGFRLVFGVVLVLLAVRLARRGRAEVALLLGCVGVVLGALAIRFVTAYRWAFWIDPDSINLVATVAVLIIIAGYLFARRLTGQRALALAGVLIISALFSSRDFISDPVGALVGYSGVALVLFGVTWDFLTASEWANRESRRFPRPTRVLFVLTYSLLTVVIVAYAALVRRRTDYGGLDSYASLGDLLLGTALLAAAATAIISVVRRDGTIT